MKTALSNVLAIGQIVFWFGLMIMWGVGLVHTYKKHDAKVFDLSFIPPVGMYWGFETFWHKDESIANDIDWSKRIPDDIYTAFELISFSDDTKNIDEEKMQMESLSKKIATYPSDKISLIKNGVIAYIKYNMSATRDQLLYLEKLKKDTTTSFKYSTLTNTYYDSIYNFYKTPEILDFKIAMDSVIAKANFNSLSEEQINLVIEGTNKVIDKYNRVYHLGFKNIFNEDYN